MCLSRKMFIAVMVCIMMVLVVSVSYAQPPMYSNEFRVIYAINDNTEGKVVITADKFLIDANNVKTIRLYLNQAEEVNGIRVHEIKGFETIDGSGPNVLKDATVMCNPIHQNYKEAWLVDDYGFPEDMKPTETNQPVGEGWANKWYSGVKSAVAFITLDKPVNLKRIEVYVGYNNKGDYLGQPAFEVAVSEKDFDEETIKTMATVTLMMRDPEGQL